MAITNLGATAFSQVGPEQWNISDFGLDALIVPMHGAESARVAYQNSLTKWSSSSVDSSMFLSGWSGNDDRQYPVIDLRYIGCKGGVLPAARSNNSFSLQSASVTDSGNQAEFQFRAPCTAWEWIQNSPPGDTPLYSGVTSGLSPLSHLVSWRITSGDASSVTYAEFIALYNALTVTVLTSDYQTEILVPNRYWRCTCVSLRTLLGN